MTTLPITYVIYLTTEGFAGCSTIYQATLDHLDRQLPLTSFRHRLASIKITPGRESVAEAMTVYLKARGFEVITATAPWERGPSHYEQYLLDMRRVSQHEAVWSTPLVMPCDHDYAMVCHRDPLPKVLARMCQLLDGSPDVLSTRFLREEDKDALAPDRTVAIEPDKDLAWSAHWNLQPMLMRSSHYYLANKVIEDNWAHAVRQHGEALWAEVLAGFSRSPRKHAVWLPGYAVVRNLGVPHYTEVAQSLGLTIAPNPQ